MKNYRNLLWVLITGAMFSFASCDSVENDDLLDIPGLDDENNDKNAGTLEAPYSVAEVIKMNPTSTSVAVQSGVWAKGYIVGYRLSDDTFNGTDTIAAGDYLGAQASYLSDFNIYIAADSTETTYTNCLSIQVTTEYRSVLGLMSNPSNFGKEVMIKGDVMKYNSVAGIKNMNNYRLNGEGPEEILPSDDVTVSGDVATAAALVEYDFEDGTKNNNIAKENWQTLFTSGERCWQYNSYNNNNYAQSTAYNASAGVKQESWLITQGLNLDLAAEKVFSFKSQYQYTSDNNIFKVYILQNIGGETVKTEVDFNRPTAAQVFTESGNIDLSSYSGVVYAAFFYSDLGGQNCMTWRIDDVLMGKSAAAPATTISIKYDHNSVFAGEELECNISTTVSNGDSATVLTASNVPAWASFVDNGNGTATIKGTAPAVAETVEITVYAENNGVTEEKVFNIVVKEKVEVNPDAPLVVNGDFANGLEGWTIKYATASDSSVYILDTADGLTIIQGATAPSGRVDFYQDITVEEGAKYKITFKYKATHKKLRIWSYGVNGEDWIYPEAANTADPFRTYNDYFPIITDWSSWSKEDDLVFTANGFTSYHLEFRVYKQVDSSLSLKDIVLEKID